MRKKGPIEEKDSGDSKEKQERWRGLVNINKLRRKVCVSGEGAKVANWNKRKLRNKGDFRQMEIEGRDCLGDLPRQI